MRTRRWLEEALTCVSVPELIDVQGQKKISEFEVKKDGDKLFVGSHKVIQNLEQTLMESKTMFGLAIGKEILAESGLE